MTEQEKAAIIDRAINAAEYLMLFSKNSGIPIRSLIGDELADELIEFAKATEPFQNLCECGFEEARWPV